MREKKSKRMHFSDESIKLHSKKRTSSKAKKKKVNIEIGTKKAVVLSIHDV